MRHRGKAAVEECIRYLKEQFGVDEEHLDFDLTGDGKMYAFRECSAISSSLVRHKGIYFGKIEKDGFRLSMDGSFLVGAKARKGVIELSDEEAKKWLRGEDLESDVRGYVILKWRSYILGCGKGDGKFIRNFVPKDRRLSS